MEVIKFIDGMEESVEFGLLQDVEAAEDAVVALVEHYTTITKDEVMGLLSGCPNLMAGLAKMGW